MKKYAASLFFAVVLLAAIIPFSQKKAFCQDDISLIKKEVAQMKEQYVEQIAALQERVKTLETAVAVHEQAIAETRHATMITAKYAPLVGYSSESADASAPGSSEIVNEVVDGNIVAAGLPQIKSLPPKQPDPYRDLMKSGEPFFDKLPSYITKGFEFHGYLRSGFGVNDKGAQQRAFQAPGAPAKYRLGNETETYGELDFINRYHPEQTGGAVFTTQVRLGFRTEEMMDYDVDFDQMMIREAFCEADNLGWDFSPDIKFWAGERFYRRLDIHINDFYIYDMSGYGGGFEDLDIPIGDSKLAVAYIGGSSDNYEFPKAGRVAKNTVDLRWYNLDVPWGKWTTWVAPSAVTSGMYTDSSGNTVSYPTAGGLAVGFIHMHEMSPTGYNQMTGQYGFGTGSDFSPNIQDPTPKIRDAWRFRLTESNVVQVNDHLSIMTDAIYQASDAGQTGPAKLTWASAGFRPVYYFNKNVALALEGGIDYVDSRLDQYSGALYKVTIAPMIKIDNTFFGRPEIRGYVTYAAWSDGFVGRVASPAYDGSQAGLAAGVQCESWW